MVPRLMGCATGERKIIIFTLFLAAWRIKGIIRRGNAANL